MLTRPLNDSDGRGRGLAAVTPPPALPMADGIDDNEETGVFSPSAPPWSSSSSSPSPPPPLLCVLSSSSALTPTPTVLSSPSSFTPPPPPPLSSSSLSAPPPPSSVTPSFTPLPPCVFFAPCTPPSSSPFSPLPSSSPLIPPSLLPLPPSPLSVSSPPFISPPLSSSSSSPLPAPSSVSPPSSTHFPSLSSFLRPSPPHSASVSFTPAPPLPPPPPPFTHNASAICSPPSSSPPVLPSLLSPPPLNPPLPFAPSLLSPPSLKPPLPVAPSPPPLPPPCCACSSLLPRLLSAHRLEVRRLLRGALASLGHRLDSLERRSRMKWRKKRNRQRGEEGGAACSPGALSSAPSCSPAHHSPVTSSSFSSSSSDNEDSPPLSSNLSQSERRRRRRKGEEEGRGRKRRRKNHRKREITTFPENREEEEDSGRFVGRMAVSFRGGAEEEAPLILHKFNHRKHRRREGGGTNQSEKTVSVFRQNGFRAPPHSASSQHALHFLQPAQSGPTSSQSEALNISSGQWRFSDLTSPLSLSSNHSAFHIWHLCSSSSFSPAPMMRLSAVAVETMSELLRRSSCGSLPRRLKDWTAPPSLSSDHCYVRTPSPSPAFSPRRQQKQRANHSSHSLPRRRPLPLCSANGLPASLAISQSEADSEFLGTNGERCKRVSQIRIRRASPRETLLTPMGLPKVKRLKKKEFSLEEIYTNKNYKSPTTNRSLETIFEEPREKDGALLLIGQQRRRRLLLFPDFTQPRKRKRPQGAGLPVAMLPRKRAAARRHCHGGGPGDDDADLDVMLVERLSALEDFLTRQGLEV